MSGIYGIVTTEMDRPVADAFNAMKPAMKLWGRDRDGAWVGEGAALGHQLHIDTPESQAEQQPVYDASGSGWRIAADARIDNREELLAKLALGSQVSPPITDDQLILHAWLKWKEACLQHLVGAFVFILWHEQARTLFAARDHLGCRPLLYENYLGRLLLASDVRAILAVNEPERRLDEKALLAKVATYAGYLRSRTFWQGVSKLEPGHYLSWKAGELTIKRHWFPELITPRIGRIPKCAGELEAVIDTAVRAQLRTIHPVGVHLSGGIDSGAVAVLADDALREQSRTLAGAYAWSPPPDSEDAKGGVEYPRIARLEKQLGLTCRFCDLTEEEYRADFQRDPTTEPTELSLYENALKPAVKNDGVGVILSGWGGDEFASFNGQGLFAGLFWQLRWRRLWRLLARSPGSLKRNWDIAWADIWNARPKALSWLGRDSTMVNFDRSYPQWRDTFSEEEMKQIVTWRKQNALKPGTRATMTSLGWYGHLAHRMTDWAALGCSGGAQYRFPLLDRRVVECALAMPDAFFFNRGISRFGMKKAFEKHLSPAVVWRSPKRENSRMARLYRASQQVLEHELPQDDDPISRYRRQSAAVSLAVKAS